MMESLETDYDAAPRPTDLEVGDGASDLNSANGSTGHKLDNFFSGLRYVRPSDGKVIPLALQSFRDPSHFPQTSQWLRLGKPPSMGTPIGKLSYWVGSSIMENGSQNQRFGPAAVGQAVVRLIIAWPVSCILIHGIEIWRLQQYRGTVMPLQETARIDESYDPVRLMSDDALTGTGPGSGGSATSPNRSLRPGSSIHDDESSGYADNIRLSAELGTSLVSTSNHSQAMLVEDQGTASRPRFLCFIQDDEQGSYKTMRVSEYLKIEGDNADTEFVFVSYTREQFRVATDEEIDNYDQYPDEDTREANRKLAKDDRQALIQCGISAAKRAGKRAFWIDFECVRDKDNVARSTSKSDDVYRICDVVRAAHSMIISIGPPASEKVEAILSAQELNFGGTEKTTQWLRHWGSRLWTLPELLLCPGEHRVQLYVSGDSGDPISLAKRNFAERAWNDAGLVKELVNHYEGSATLSQLRLIDTALACFSRRGTNAFSPGDIAYAIMGLLPTSQRPAVRQDDSGFQAFARLSLANDGGDFLGRLICLFPQSENAPWYDTSDVWNAKVSDLHPRVRVAKVVEDDTLLMDGLYGAAIKWDGFPYSTREGESANGWTWATLTVIMGLSVSFPLCVSIQRLATETMTELHYPPGLRLVMIVTVVIVPVVAALIVPIIYIISRPHTRSITKAHLVGIEGHVDAGAVERHLWGFNHGRFSTITSDAQFQDEDQEQLNGVKLETGNKHAFTLVDTHMMTVLHFYAHNPPVAMLIMGEEGDLQRAFLCSYRWQKNVLIRETVLRLPNKVLDRVKRVDRLRLCFASAAMDASLKVNEYKRQQDQKGCHLDKSTDASSSWRSEMIFAAILLLTLQINVQPDYQELGRSTSKASFGIAFAVAQVGAYFLISRIAITEILPSLLILKAFLPVLPLLNQWDSSWFFIRLILMGAVDGTLLSVLITIVCSWYRPRSLPIRILVFVIFNDVISLLGLMWQGGSANSRFWVGIGRVLYFMLCLNLACGALYSIGLPMEVSWLPGYQKVQISGHAAMEEASGSIDAAWAHSNRSWLRDPRPLIFFGISISIFMTTGAKWHTNGPLLHLGYLVTAILVLAFVISKTQRLTVPVILVLTILSCLGSGLHNLNRPASDAFIINGLLSLRWMILPLLWISSVNSAGSWVAGLRALAMTQAGMSLGELLKLTLPFVNIWPVRLPVQLVGIGLVTYVWLNDEKSRRQRISPLEAELARTPPPDIIVS